MELELEGWKVRLALVALALLVVMAPFGCAVRANKSRAEGWHRRAVDAEESVAGLRFVIVDRSRELNRRTLQANQLVSRLNSNRVALRRSKVDVGSLTRRQRELASENARIAKESRALRARQTTLETVASRLSACVKGLGGAIDVGQGKGARKLSAVARARLASCTRASASLDAYLRQSR